MSFLASVVISRKTITNDIWNEEMEENMEPSLNSSVHDSEFDLSATVPSDDERGVTDLESLSIMTDRTEAMTERVDFSREAAMTGSKTSALKNGDSESNVCTKKRKKDATDEILDFMRSTTSVLTEKDDDDPDRNFLLSMLPDFKELSKEAKYKAKMGFLSLLHELGK
ncbi:uncharacterized protein LOC118193199 [Stegodyphus dumicola]|uniref:uncharacterized protein LOC118193199 n=1 Tax=Stegodyphus dumicola TaxID=202533 RepID=UPI0015B08E21|nr:uncharacterized protein LOC118193199 [Stegodyphus dumicola]